MVNEYTGTEPQFMNLMTNGAIDVSKQKHTPQAFRCLSNMLKLLVALICAVLKILQALGEIIQFKTKVNYENCCFKLLQLLPVVSNIY